jgi:hypothetical protein
MSGLMSKKVTFFSIYISSIFELIFCYYYNLTRRTAKLVTGEGISAKKDD